MSRLGLVCRFFDFLGLDEANNNVHNIRLCRQIVAAGAAPASVIAELQAIDKVLYYLKVGCLNLFGRLSEAEQRLP